MKLNFSRINFMQLIAVLILFVLFSSGKTIAAQDKADPLASGEPGVIASAPVNDNFANAAIISGASGQIQGTTVQATKESGEPRHGGVGGGNSVWYQFTAPDSGNMRVYVQGASVLTIYKGSSLNNLVQLAMNDDADSFAGSELIFGTNAGETYQIAVDSKFVNSVPYTTAFAINWNFSHNAFGDNFAAPMFINPEGTTVISNVNATKEAGEPNIAGSPGGKSVWFVINPVLSGPGTSYTFSTRGSTYQNGISNMDTLLAVYTGNSVGALTLLGSNDDLNGTTRHSQVTVTLNAGAGPFYIAIDGYSSPNTPTATGNIVLTWAETRGTIASDFDGDRQTDFAIFRPSTGAWYNLSSIDGSFTAALWGVETDRPQPGDFDGDGKTDLVVYRYAEGAWYVFQSRTQTWRVINWGLPTDTPVAGDYDGNGLMDAAVFRQFEGTWLINTPQPMYVQFGQFGDTPVTADFDGDNKTDIAVFRPQSGTWYIRKSSTGGVIVRAFGQSGDVPVPADYDGDGRADVAIYRDGTWWILRSHDQSVAVYQFGLPGDKPAPANYNSYDPRVQLVVFRPSDGNWYFFDPHFYQTGAFHFGVNGDVPTSVIYR
jgi:hypothetical protein